MNSLVLDPTENPSDDAFVPFVVRKHSPHRKHACFSKEVDTDGVCTITFDTPGSDANVWNAETLDELDCHIEDLHRDDSVRALIFRSAKPRIFIAGADLKSLVSLDEEHLHELLSLGQDVFTHLTTLPFPKVAAIHGACLGGGLELALACDWRIASDDDSTRLGLPETQIGLIPAWGGSTRLPRLIGLRKSLDLILRGKILRARDARRAGFVDEVTAVEHLDRLARRFALQSKSRPKKHFFTHVWPLPMLLAGQTKRSLATKFPWMKSEVSAPLLAAEVITKGVMRTEQGSLALEQSAISSLIRTPLSASFIRAFFAKETASKKMPAPLRGIETGIIRNAAVIGSGVMGAGIAGVLAGKGVRVLLQDSSAEALAKGMSRIGESLNGAIRKRALTKKQVHQAMDRLTAVCGPVPLGQSDLVIEAAVEDLKIKKQIFQSLADRSSPSTILATNTSALSVSELAAATPHPERVIGLHFFNPPHLMPLVEIITHDRSSKEVMATALRFVQSLGKTPVLVKDSPGFVVNRILMPYLMGAVELAETMQNPWLIDDAMMSFGMPMGPLRLLDEIGFDVALHVSTTLTSAFPDRMKPGTLLDALVNDGHLGRKSGAGFYRHSRRGTAPNHTIKKHLCKDRLTIAPHPDEIAERLAGLMRKEARRCLDDGIVADENDIRLAMMLGAGFPPFRKLL